MDDLILAVMKHVNLWDVDCFIISLRRSGYSGRVVFFVENITDEAVAHLTRNGVELIPFSTPAEALSTHFQTARYGPAAAYLVTHQHEFRNVMWSDVWDVVFQSNPMEYLAWHMPPHRLLIAKEGRKIKSGNGQGINEVWIRKFLPPETCAWLREEEVLCVGTVMGDAEIMSLLMSKIAERINRSDGMQGLDQGIFNYLMRTSPFKEAARIPEMHEAFISTCGMFMAEYNNEEWTVQPPYLDRSTGLVLVEEGGKPFSVVHCYNRAGGFLNPVGDFRAILERRYREPAA